MQVIASLVTLRTLLVSAVSSVFLSVCASTQTTGSTAPPNVFLQLKHQKQDINLCVPTAASMVLEYYGENRDPKYLKSIATPPGSTFPGTYMKDMVAGVRKLGYRWEQECFSTDGAGFLQGLPKLKRSVLDRRPVMVGVYDPPIGHVVVLVGVDDAKKELTFLDSNKPYPGLWTVTEDRFRTMWRENIVNSRCAIISRPRKA